MHAKYSAAIVLSVSCLRNAQQQTQSYLEIVAILLANGGTG